MNVSISARASTSVTDIPPAPAEELARRDGHGDAVTGPPETMPREDTPSATSESGQEPAGDWAICCSGGGIRSATYCLGGLQSLDQHGLLGKAKWIVGVSGGSYIAASRALVADGLRRAEKRHQADGGNQPKDERHAYARGT